MQIFSEIAPLSAYLAGERREDRVALVPTMGALHDGHGACVREAAAVPDAVLAVSIFVNPAQFGAGEDLDAYPRPMERDLELCREWGCDVVFAPAPDEMYPVPQSVWVDVEGLTEPLCGIGRPGHFRGVTTVVAKLFNIVQPDVAVFGQKDAQQALVIREMVRQLDMPVELRVARTVREADGLAMSSRNAYLSEEDRGKAVGIFRGLQAASEMIAEGERAARLLEARVLEVMKAAGISDVEYCEVRRESLSALERIEGRVILAVAARVGGTRLIDNMVFEIDGDVAATDVALF
jgi:pantoate--beta-alanine ligase